MSDILEHAEGGVLTLTLNRDNRAFLEPLGRGEEHRVARGQPMHDFDHLGRER